MSATIKGAGRNPCSFFYGCSGPLMWPIQQERALLIKPILLHAVALLDTCFRGSQKDVDAAFLLLNRFFDTGSGLAINSFNVLKYEHCD